MIRLRRSGVKQPADWQEKVDAAFPDAAAFWKKARGFERLAEQGAKRRKGFAAYAPEVLPRNAKGEPEFPPVWRNDERVRQAIAGMSHGFCAYCQLPVSSSHPGAGGEEKPPGQVEHFKPKTRFPAQAYALENYFLACMGCNGAKHDKWPSGGYVRPDEGKPGSRFVFDENGEVEGCKGDAQAERTVEDFDLKRHWLTYTDGWRSRPIFFVRRMIGRSDTPLEELLIQGPAQFSEAINQNVQRAWQEVKLKKRVKRARSGGDRCR